MTMNYKLALLKAQRLRRRGSNSTQGSAFSGGNNNPSSRTQTQGATSERSYGVRDAAVDVSQLIGNDTATGFSGEGGGFGGSGASGSFDSSDTGGSNAD
jgi:hypothetical protein